MVDVSFTMIMQWINFGILLTLLYVLLFKPIVSFLDKRAQGIESDITEAEENKVKSQKVLSDYEEKLKEIRAEADAICAEARKRAEKEKNRILDEAEVEAQAIASSARKEIAREAEKATHELKSTMASLVLNCATKVLEREISESDHKQLIEDFLASK